ncbi:MAG: arsenite methyltransferase [Chloroflexi bacterium]|nr:arsenite methyltransferase [Chloroflexota bacterium]
MKQEKIHKTVRERYGKIAKTKTEPCGCGCCGGTSSSEQIGYSKGELASVPNGADLNLGCGNPVALASLREGETVVDLGSGGGLDCFLASKKVGAKGKVIGIDMTAGMLERARANCKKGGYKNVEFRLGEIENLPVADNTADIIISNCVINLSPDKQRVFNEAYRVLKPKGRLMISDMVLLKELPEKVKASVFAYVGCVAGADMKEDYLGKIKQAGFGQVEVVEENHLPEAMLDEPDIKAFVEEQKLAKREIADISEAVVSIRVSAVKP